MSINTMQTHCKKVTYKMRHVTLHTFQWAVW